MKLIGVWGSPSGGKTTIALELAKNITHLTDKNCLLIFTEDKGNPLSYLFPSQNDIGGSLGEIVTRTNFNQTELKQSLVWHPENDRICFLGFRNDESRYNYSKISKEQANDLFVNLTYMLDYVIVDCQADFKNDPISQYALKEGRCINVGGGDLKSLSFYNSMNSQMRDYNGLRTDCIQVANNPWDFDTWDLVAEKYKNVKYTFPYNADIQDAYLEEDNMKLLKNTKDNRVFIRELNLLTNDLFDLEDDEPKSKWGLNRSSNSKEKSTRAKRGKSPKEKKQRVVKEKRIKEKKPKEKKSLFRKRTKGE